MSDNEQRRNENEQWIWFAAIVFGFLLTGINEAGILLGAAIIVVAALRLGFLFKS